MSSNKEVVRKFLNKEKGRAANLKSTGNELLLFGNKIAYFNKNYDIIVRTCGWSSRTTFKILNELFAETAESQAHNFLNFTYVSSLNDNVLLSRSILSYRSMIETLPNLTIKEIEELIWITGEWNGKDINLNKNIILAKSPLKFTE